MKKSLASIFAFVVLLFSATANATVAISAPDAYGYPGDNVSLVVSLVSGNVTDGGNFKIGVGITNLAPPSVFGNVSGLYDFSISFYDSGVLYLAYSGTPDPAVGPIDNIFSILFSIPDSYSPPSGFPDVTTVTIDWYAPTDDNFQTSLFRIEPTVTVRARTVPEPGVLGLTGLALLIMTVAGRRRSANPG